MCLHQSNRLDPLQNTCEWLCSMPPNRVDIHFSLSKLSVLHQCISLCAAKLKKKRKLKNETKFPKQRCFFTGENFHEEKFFNQKNDFFSSEFLLFASDSLVLYRNFQREQLIVRCRFHIQICRMSHLEHFLFDQSIFFATIQFFLRYRLL